MAVCACWPRWASVSKPPELSLSHSSLVTRMFWRFLCFHCLVCCCFFIFWFLVQPVSLSDSRFCCDVIASRPCKNLQQNPPQKAFFSWFFHRIFTTWGSFFTRLSYRLRRSVEGCDPGMLEEQHWIQFVTNQQQSWLFLVKDFLGSRLFSFFLVAQHLETESSESRCFWWLNSFFGFACFYGEMERERGATSSVKSSVSKPLLQHAIE